MTRKEEERDKEVARPSVESFEETGDIRSDRTAVSSTSPSMIVLLVLCC
jgi:hypothetical protein